MGVFVNWAVFLLLLISSSSAEEKTPVIADVLIAKDLFDFSIYHYLDVRTVEVRDGQADVAKIVNIPYMFNTAHGRMKNPDFLEEVASITKEDDAWVVGSQTGGRSLQATTYLLKAGFNVINTGGGCQAWVESGFKVKVDQKPDVITLHHPESSDLFG